ncbi:hypothetical protein [Clostridium tertium]|uniref:hypothetical protein n=1 Tax=Clostridium tertium TaxID=1559 RepID=UPI0023B24A88|nr:hypothetical protein [Clostridium tertium]
MRFIESNTSKRCNPITKETIRLYGSEFYKIVDLADNEYYEVYQCSEAEIQAKIDDLTKDDIERIFAYDRYKPQI